ncbi:MAG: c-type cytochrome [Pirellula sp.]|nr:c-type cytochrome [Pirellula sp.]
MFHVRFWSLPFIALIQAASGGLAMIPFTALDGNDLAVEMPKTDDAEFGLTIRSTPHRTPQQELAGFHVPKGFEVDLIASEPTIFKPLNIAFDARNRLWVTQTQQYPFPTKEGDEQTDSIIVLEDKDSNGSFESSKIFASGLNIPIGVLPVQDGAICFSIPHIWHLKDTDDDGVCDERSILYGPFDTTRDTHGMVNSLRDGRDGWIYACHGFNNQSVVRGTDGHEVAMTSGNIFRFRADGSRIEPYTQGQVNPFGMTRDAYNNWFTADCHSKPISQLVRGGCYPSFGRPDDGLGFVPDMMDHLHGSTAIAGLAHTADSRFPKEMEHQFLSGNVMTCRINRNQLVYQGASAKAIECTDLLTSEDPWFRPVDLVFGPDGHLYVADFYNKIIGHYEVPLNHPDRDRTSGRIWRIRWTGNDAITPTNSRSPSEPAPLESLTNLNLKNSDEAFRWIRNVDSASETATPQTVEWLLQQSETIAKYNDPVLSQAFLISLRRSIQNAKRDSNDTVLGIVAKVASSGRNEQQLALLKVLPSVGDSRYVASLLNLIQSRQETGVTSKQELRSILDRLAGVVDEANMPSYIQLMINSLDDQSASNLNSLADRVQQLMKLQRDRLGAISPTLKKYATEVFEKLERSISNSAETPMIASWVPTSLTNDRRNWSTQTRSRETSPNGTKAIPVYSSFPLGESYTGSWTTPPFSAPRSMSFVICGHNALPSEPDTQLNFVRLWKWNKASGQREEIRRAYPPRSDIAKEVHWDLSDEHGEMVSIEIVDQDRNGSYAWIAAGDFSMPELNLSQTRENADRLLAIGEMLPYSELPSQSLQNLLGTTSKLDLRSKLRLARSHMSSTGAMQTNLVEFAMEQSQWDLISTLPAVDFSSDIGRTSWLNSAQDLFPEVLKRLTSEQQSQLLARLSSLREAPDRVVQWLDKGLVGVDALKSIPTSWWDSLSPDQQPRLQPYRDRLAKLVDKSQIVKDRLVQTRVANVDEGLGKKVYTEKCSLCHQLGTTGNVLGPQLEGVGNRGEERLCEDILWPDRNVDEAFRVTLFLLSDDTTVTGLVTERTDSTVTVADQTGQKRSIRLDDIEQEKRSEVSLMPGNFSETLTADELASLLAYLKQSTKKVP